VAAKSGIDAPRKAPGVVGEVSFFGEGTCAFLPCRSRYVRWSATGTPPAVDTNASMAG